MDLLDYNLSSATVLNHLNEHFYYHGRGNNHGWWASYEKTGEQTIENPGLAPMVDLIKPISGKTFGHITILVLDSQEQYGLNIKIEVFLPSYNEFYTVFEGWVSMVIKLYSLFNLLGIDNINYKNT